MSVQSFQQIITFLKFVSVAFILILTLITIYHYKKYLLYRKNDLSTIVSSLKSSKYNSTISRKQFESSLLPRHFTDFVQQHLSDQLDYYLIISCATGLGNRFQSIASAFLMAIVTHRRLVIDWPVTGLSACEFHQLFQPQVMLSSTLLNLYTKEYILSNSEHLRFHGPFDELLCHSNLTLFKRKSKFLFLLTDEYFMTVLFKNPNYKQTLFQGVNEDDLFRSLINYLFVPSKELNDRIMMESQINGPCDKGIHIRKHGLKRLTANNEKIFFGT